MKRNLAAPAIVAALLTSAAASVWADGYEFFTVDRGKEANLVYVGQLRDKDSGRIVRAPAYFMVTEKRSGMTFPFVNDRPGHYRSPDIGESVEQLAGTAVNPNDLEFELEVAGYKKVTASTMPRKSKGVVELNFKLERDAAVAGDAANGGAVQASRPPELVDHSTQSQAAIADAAAAAREGRSIRLMLMAVAGIGIIGGVATRTLGPRQSTSR
jgi:hypothetical protein